MFGEKTPEIRLTKVVFPVPDFPSIIKGTPFLIFKLIFLKILLFLNLNDTFEITTELIFSLIIFLILFC